MNFAALLVLVVFTQCIFSLRTSLSESACPTPRLKNGRIRARNRGRTIRYSCFPDYELVGNRYSTCKRGSWDTPTPICVSPRCAAMPTPKHAVVGAKYRGAILMYFCEPSFVLVGNAEIYCDGRQWNGSAPSCRDSNAVAPTSCDFEKDDLCWWEQDPRHDFDWTRHRFDTPSSHIGTGPTHDHTLGFGYDGYYLYIEASGRLINDTARIISPLYPANLTESRCFSFWYHMYGTAIGSLNVYFKPEMEKIPKLMWTKQGNQGKDWLHGAFNLPTVNSSFQIIIEGVRGPTYVSDIAIDDLAITKGDECVVNNEPPSGASENDDDEVERINAVQSCRDRCVDNLETTMIPDAYSYPEICQCTIDCAESGSCCPDYAEFCIYEITDPVETIVPSSSIPSSKSVLVSTSSIPPTENLTQLTTATSTVSTIKEVPTTRATVQTTTPVKKIDVITSTRTTTVTPKTTIPTTEKTTTTTTTTTKPSTTMRTTTRAVITTSKAVPPFFVPLYRTSAPNKDPYTRSGLRFAESRVPIQDARQGKEPTNLSFSKIIRISVGAALMIAVVTIAASYILRRRSLWDRSFKGSAFSEDSDVLFLTSDEHLDFTLAKPSGESVKA